MGKKSSKFVKAAREQLGLSQIEFGEKMGVSRHTIWRYETGGTLPTRSRIIITKLLEEEEDQKK